jgi:hypothetical protein
MNGLGSFLQNKRWTNEEARVGSAALATVALDVGRPHDFRDSE